MPNAIVESSHFDDFGSGLDMRHDGWMLLGKIWLLCSLLQTANRRPSGGRFDANSNSLASERWRGRIVFSCQSDSFFNALSESPWMLFKGTSAGSFSCTQANKPG
jgi:hypothetical protein